MSSYQNAPFAATYSLNEGSTVSATTRILLIDLSDNTNWPHSLTNQIILMGFIWDSVLTTNAEDWSIRFSVVTENDGTDGSVKTLQNLVTEVQDLPLPSRQLWMPPGLDLEVVDDKLVNVVSNLGINNSAVYKNDAAFDSPAGSGKNIAAGDLLLEIIKPAEGSGTLAGTFTALYLTE